MLITGGRTLKTGTSERTDLSSVEIFDPSNPSLTCTLPNMNATRFYHSAVGMTVCGDDEYGDGSQTCETLDGQQWTFSHQLQQERAGHVMWLLPNKGVMLIGGFNSGSHSTVETLQDDGSSVMQQWKLKYDTE